MRLTLLLLVITLLYSSCAFGVRVGFRASGGHNHAHTGEISTANNAILDMYVSAQDPPAPSFDESNEIPAIKPKSPKDDSIEDQKNGAMKRDQKLETGVMIHKPVKGDSLELLDQVMKIRQEQMKERRKKKKIQNLMEIFSRTESQVAAASADTELSDISNANEIDSMSSTRERGEVAVSVGVAGDVLGLTAGGENLLTAPLVTGVNPNRRVYHGRITQQIAIDYHVDSGHAWTAAGGGTNRVLIDYAGVGTPGGATLLFAANNHAQHNLPVGINRFTLVHKNQGGATLASYTILLTYNDITVGVELEDTGMRVKLCSISINDIFCENLEYATVIASSPATPAGPPYLSLVVEGETAKTVIIEYVTGPVGIGQTAGAVPGDALDMQRALSHLIAEMDLDLMGTGHGVAGQSSWCQVNGGASDHTRFMPLDTLITKYNTRIAADGLFVNHANWILSLPRNSALTTNLNAWRLAVTHFTWRIRCTYVPGYLDVQVNMMTPLSAIGARKMAGPNYGALNPLAGFTHFIDLFPDAGTDAEWGYIVNYVTRSQLIAHRLLTENLLQLNGVNNPISAAVALLNLPAWQIQEYKGYIAAVLMVTMHATNAQCSRDHKGESLKPSVRKNHHTALIKSCLADIGRYFPTALTDIMADWWAGAHIAVGNAVQKQNAVIQSIIDLYNAAAGVGGVAVDGSVSHDRCLAWPAQGQTNVEHFEHRFRFLLRTYAIPAFEHRVEFASRYNGESNAHQGTMGVTSSDNFPGDPWSCQTGVYRTSAYPPFTDRQFSQLAILVESRYDQSPLNQAFQPNLNPTTPTNLATVFDVIRTITNSA